MSAIILWKLARLVQLGRLALDLDDAQIVRTLRQMRKSGHAIWKSPGPLPSSISRVIPRIS
jgi:hypothetical protein